MNLAKFRINSVVQLYSCRFVRTKTSDGVDYVEYITMLLGLLRYPNTLIAINIPTAVFPWLLLQFVTPSTSIVERVKDSECCCLVAMQKRYKRMLITLDGVWFLLKKNKNNAPSHPHHDVRHHDTSTACSRRLWLDQNVPIDTQTVPVAAAHVNTLFGILSSLEYEVCRACQRSHWLLQPMFFWFRSNRVKVLCSCAC